MSKITHLNSHLIVAMPWMSDPRFRQSVVYLHTHDDSGASGIIINKPTKTSINELFDQLDINTKSKSQTDRLVMLGGPVGREQGFILHSDKKLTNGINMSVSKELLTDIAQGDGPEDYLVALGYSEWKSDQLEDEIIDNHWLVAPCDYALIFKTPFHDRWKHAAELVGVDFTKLSQDVGNA